MPQWRILQAQRSDNVDLGVIYRVSGRVGYIHLGRQVEHEVRPGPTEYFLSRPVSNVGVMGVLMGSGLQLAVSTP